VKIAAIDIGSNAVRLLIKEIISDRKRVDSIKISYTRVPIRLGEDVFTEGKISESKVSQLTKTMKAFKHLMDVQNIKLFRACATSAMREAKNNEEVIKHVAKETKIKIDLITGEQEAELIFANFVTQRLNKDSVYLYIDVGGGSTELSVIRKGKKGKAASFKLGTERILEDKDKKDDWEKMKVFAQNLGDKYPEITGIGTGGNINRIFKESRRKTNENITLKEIEHINEYIQSFSMIDRTRLLNLKPDRADVIIPAAKIYLYVMKNTGIKELIVPKIGLSDGIIFDLYQEQMQK